MTNLWSYFSHGSEYDEGVTKEEPRGECCRSCAFGNNPETVRPGDVTIKELIEHTNDYDAFYCHTPVEDGTYRICKKWFKLHGYEGIERRNQEINDILMRDLE